MDYKQDALQKIDDAQQTVAILIEAMVHGHLNLDEVLRRLHAIQADLKKAQFLLELS